MSDEGSSYRQILRSSSIMGGAQALNYLVSLIRVKIVAVLLGPAGVGLVSVYTSVIGLVGTVSGLGISSSGVREVACAFNQQDQRAVAQTALILRRTCWITGLLGWALAVILAIPLSDWASGSSEHAVAIGLLGVTLLFSAVSGGQTALLQGMRRIGDVARANVFAMLLNTVVAIVLYSCLGKRGIVPVLVVTSIISLGVSWWFARRIRIEPILLSWSHTIQGARHLTGLGIAFMWSGLLITGLDMITRSLITRLQGIDAAGLYQAAWALSGLFANFILTSMGTDFYPRLTSVIQEPEIAGQLINEQTEIGVLLALPGLLITLVLAPWLIEMFYSKEFLAGSALLPWFVIGIFGRVVSWPLGYIQQAKGASSWFAITETSIIIIQLCLLLWSVPRFGVVGTAYTFAITYLVYTLIMLWVSKLLIGFRWSNSVKKLLLMASGFIMLGLYVRLFVQGSLGMIIGGGLALFVFIVSLRGLTVRVGVNHKLIKMICHIPGGEWIISVKRESNN